MNPFVRLATLAVIPALCAGALPANLTEAAESADQVANLRAEHRHGQTFLTWSQIPGENVDYRIYRSSEPILRADQLTTASLAAQVKDFTGLNWMASLNRAQASQTRPPGSYELPQRIGFVIEEGRRPLPPETGLFVYTAKTPQAAWYAVTAIADGREIRIVDSSPGGNALHEPVQEVAGPPVPVRQNEEGDYVHWTDNEGTPSYPAMSSIPSVPYIFRVRLPDGDGPFPLVVWLHASQMQYNSRELRALAAGAPLEPPRSIQLQLDTPNMGGEVKGLRLTPLIPGGWHGYNENFGTDRPTSEGETIDYHARRVLWTLDWAQSAFPVDPDRISIEGASMGGIGAITVGLRNPERFAALRARMPIVQSPRGRGGSSSMLPFDAIEYVSSHPEIEFPHITITAGRTDTLVGWLDKLAFARAAAEAKVACVFIWHAGDHWEKAPEDAGPLPPKIPEPELESFSLRQSLPAIANCTADDDPGTENLAVAPERRPAYDAPGVGDLVGTLGGAVDWDRDTIIDEPERYEITLRLKAFAKIDSAVADVTPRRLQGFEIPAGAACVFQTLDSESGRTLAEGACSIDDHNRLTAPGIPINKTGVRLKIIRTPK